MLNIHYPHQGGLILRLIHFIKVFLLDDASADIV